jgi:hypothetical protein
MPEDAVEGDNARIDTAFPLRAGEAKDGHLQPAHRGAELADDVDEFQV